MTYMSKLNQAGDAWIPQPWESFDPQSGVGGQQIVQTVTGVTTGGAAIAIVDDARSRFLWIKSAALLAAKQVTLPAGTPVGMSHKVASDKGVTVLTWAGGFTIYNDPGLLAANAPIEVERISATEWVVK